MEIFPSFLVLLSSAEASMDKMQTLMEFENFYDVIQPAYEKSAEAFAWFSSIPHPLFNAVIHLSSKDVQSKVDQFINQAGTGCPLSFWVHSQNRAQGLVDILHERQFHPIITCPLMVWAVQPVPAAKGDIRLADDREAFHEILSVVYQMDPAVKREFRHLMDNVECENYILYAENKPVSTATLMVQGEVGGVFNDATLPERREASLEMVRFLMHRSRELGLKRVIVLSSPEGEELYGGLGFENVFNIDIYAKN